MGGNSSSSRNTTNNDSVQPTIQKDLASLCSSNLNSYMEACKQDPDLGSFDSMFHERTKQAMKSLVSEPGNESRPLDSITQVLHWLIETSKEVVESITKREEGVWNNKEFSSLVNMYFKNSAKILDFCNTVEKCVKRAGNSKLIIQFAIKQFEEEKKMEIKEGVSQEKYKKTLDELKKIKAAGDPFGQDFFTLLKSVYEEQAKLLKKLLDQQEQLDKAFENAKHCKMVWKIVFVTALISVLVIGVVATTMSAPAVAAVAFALEAPTATIGKWCIDLWSRYENELKGQKDTVTLMLKHHSWVKIAYMDELCRLIERLDIRMKSVTETACFSIERGNFDAAVESAMVKIMEELDKFTESIETLGDHADKCFKDIMKVREALRQHITSFTSHSSASTKQNFASGNVTSIR